MKRKLCILVIACGAASSCVPAIDQQSEQAGPPIETEFSLINLSRQWYWTVAMRTSGSGGAYRQLSELLPPGAVLRKRFLDVLPESGGCPEKIDLRLYLFSVTQDSVPTIVPGDPCAGDQCTQLDFDSFVDPNSVIATEFSGISVCPPGAVPLSTFTMALLESGLVRFAQGSGREEKRMIKRELLPSPDPMPTVLDGDDISGVVLNELGDLQAGVGVLLRTRYRVNEDDTELCPNDPVGLCLSDPIAFCVTDEQGAFCFSRPAGAYLVEVFGDGFLFRPKFELIEAPIDNILFVAERTP